MAAASATPVKKVKASAVAIITTSVRIISTTAYGEVRLM
jgi:hypothetical protein